MDSKLQARPIYNHALMFERFKYEEKFFFVNEKFIPNLKASQLTSKFYARHDMIRPEDVEPRLMEMIQEADTHGPKDKYNEPVLESQVYGWYSRPLIAQDRNDRRLHFHCRYEDISKYGSLLRQTDKLIGSKH